MQNISFFQQAKPDAWIAKSKLLKRSQKMLNYLKAPIYWAAY